MACVMSNATIEHPEAVRTLIVDTGSSQVSQVCLFGIEISQEDLVFQMVKVAESLEQLQDKY